MGDRRKTVAVLIDHIDHISVGYETRLRAGFEIACGAHDLNLLIVVGRSVDSPAAKDAVHNRVYELLNQDSADGVILVSAGLANYSGLDGIRRLVERYQPLPLCSLGLAMPGIPSVVVNNKPGMEDVVEHLIWDHGCRRLAFIGGPTPNPDAAARLDAYKEVLLRHGVPFDPELVEVGLFTRQSGADALERLLLRGVKCDAIVAANDLMAQGAIDVLRARGLRVPRDLPVTGFDDLPMSRFTSPPLTTVRQPLSRMAGAAVNLIWEQMANRPVPARTELPVEMVRRISCGCDGPAERALRREPGPETPEAWLEQNYDRLLPALTSSLSVNRTVAALWAERLLSGLRAEFSGLAGTFLSTLEALLETANDDESHEELQGIVTLLREEFKKSELEDLWHAARKAIALGNTHHHAQQSTNMEAAYVRLLRSGERFSSALDLSSLRRALTEELPASVRNAYISLYRNGDRSALEPFFCLREGLRQEAILETSAGLLPSSYSDARRHTSFVLPLTFEAECFGVAVFEFGSTSPVHQMIRDQISAALRSIALHREVLEKTVLHERSVQERASTAKHMSSLSVLASGVAHDLNNALGPLVALPDIILQGLDDIRSGKDDAELRSDVATIKAAGLRAAQTIKDLLTLGRQGRISRDLIDLNQTVRQYLSGEPARFDGTERRKLEIDLDLCAEPLVVRASEAHVVRAISNLLWNAADAMDSSGRVSIQTSRARLTEPLFGYETIEAGEYALVTVSDTGSGIPPSELNRIFEPFFTRKKLSDGSGSGLGLAIVHGVVKEHAGFVNVESELGQGTRFTLYFPTASDALQSSLEAEEAPRGSATILVIDDDPIQLRTAQRVLTAIGYQVATAHSGAQALEQLSAARVAGNPQSPYRLVVLDMLLGEALDGLAVFERLRSLFPEQRGILASGHAPTDRGRLAAEMGLSWLVKPYTSDALARAVAAALASSTVSAAPLGAPIPSERPERYSMLDARTALPSSG